MQSKENHLPALCPSQALGRDLLGKEIILSPRNRGAHGESLASFPRSEVTKFYKLRVLKQQSSSRVVLFNLSQHMAHINNYSVAHQKI